MREEYFNYVECDECGGEGRCEYEYAVVDWVHGGELRAKMDTCEKCDGSGELKKYIWEEEE